MNTKIIFEYMKIETYIFSHYVRGLGGGGGINAIADIMINKDDQRPVEV